MKKLFTISVSLFIFTICLSGKVRAQCSVAIPYSQPTNSTYAFVTGQSFKPTCTAKLNNVTFPTIAPFSDDLRSSGYSVGIRIKDASNNILANGYWANGSLQTDVWYPNAKNVIADFQCSDLTLVIGNTYIWEVYAIPGKNVQNTELILFGTKNNIYADGSYIKDGAVQTTDILGWGVNLSSTVIPLAATQTQINPASATSTDGFASVSVSGGISSATTTYVWKKNGNVLASQTSSSISNIGIGSYSVDITKGCTITKAFTLTASNPLSISTQPSNTSQTVVQNESATALSVTTLGGTSPYTYQWYSNTSNSNSGGSVISGAVMSSYMPATSTVGTTYYYVVIKDNASPKGTVSSNVSGAVTVTAALPVTLASFVAVKQESTASLSWSTTSEVNSEKFDVQRSADGKNWKMIASVAAENSGTALQSYRFVDDLPLVGHNLYRLKMIDLDGSFAYSRIQNVVFAELSVMMAYPNPSSGLTTVQLGKNNIGGQASLINASGWILRKINIDDEAVSVDFGSLAAGVYLLKAPDGKTVKVVKQ